MNEHTIATIIITALLTSVVTWGVRKILPGKLERRVVSPQPLLVRKDPEFVTGEVCARNHHDFLKRLAALETRTDKLEEKLTAIARDITAAGEDRVRRLHQRIDAVCASLEGDLKNIPQQIISILKNTGAIGRMMNDE